MAMPAVKHEHRGEYPSSPRLRLVRNSLRRGQHRSAPSSRQKACQVARCRRNFRLACTALVLLAGIGMVRVELTVRATETSLITNTLRQDIENERIRSEALEARRTALCAPGRIESIACVSMGMGAADSVAYLDLPDAGTEAADQPLYADMSAADGPSGRIAGVLASIMRMTAGEAQVLLVGDAGLASSR